MENSIYPNKAKELIGEVRGQTLSIEERRKRAIELAALILQEARRIQTGSEYRRHAQVDRMLDDPQGKLLTTSLADQLFRSQNPVRTADQAAWLIHTFGIPDYLSYFKQLQLLAFRWVGNIIPQLLVPLLKHSVRKQAASIILPGENRQLAKHMNRRRKEGVRMNLNHLGEAILGEEEAEKMFRTYLDDLSLPEVEYISVKISSICSQLHLLAWEETMDILAKRLKALFLEAKRHTYVLATGKCVPKFVNLDMESYCDLHLTVAVFRSVLEDPQFFHHRAGIVLQSYLPDSYLLQQELTVWAMQRVANGGSPIKIRLVKGANLAMEKIEASLRGWPQAPYTTKADVDANFKRMLHYGCLPEHACAANLGIGSHNLFDIAYALLLRSEMGVEKEVEFELLEGVADHVRRVIQQIDGAPRLYCPAAKKEHFHNALAYLLRRLDENSAPDNFLRHSFDLLPQTKEWHHQAHQFSLACHAVDGISMHPRRTQNRLNESDVPDPSAPFCNEPDTDWSLPQNRKWGQQILQHWAAHSFEPVPLVIGKKTYPPRQLSRSGYDPSIPKKELYRFALADHAQVEKAIHAAEKAQHKWKNTSVEERSGLLARLAQLIRKHRDRLIGAMVADGGKIVTEADGEVSEAVDFVEYYRKSSEELSRMSDIRWSPVGPVLVAPPWNFPCSIPLGSIVAALAAGNCVIFKPALETVYAGWVLAQLCWEAGISQEVLQFLPCEDEPFGSELVKDPRIASVILTGEAKTAKKMLLLRSGLDLITESGGKNTMIITAMSDRDLAIKDLVRSAFSHSGQKCSACSLAILEAEVYENRTFMRLLRDAASSLHAGSAWKPATRINPLIGEPNERLLRALTTLEEGEEWLLEPRQVPDHPNLWTPGIKLGVQEGSFTHQHELFGPVLGIMHADNLAHAVQLANGTPYGLTAGLHSLDERERRYWLKHIQAGNCYINRGMTGAIVRRQPFGGCKESCFGAGAKVGGPNFLLPLMRKEQATLPKERELVTSKINLINIHVNQMDFASEQKTCWHASVENYTYHWKHYFSKKHDPSCILGQDNWLYYVPHSHLLLRIAEEDEPFDVLRAIAGAMICGTPIQASGKKEALAPIKGKWVKFAPKVELKEETEEQLIERLREGDLQRVRLLSSPLLPLKHCLAEHVRHAIIAPVLANGRVELLHYLREVSVSIDYHRYGNLGTREGEE
ncbi:MAG: proline dehydrogenase family protein [Waddliaceae bacterium]